MQQLKPLSLRRNFSWTFAGNVVYAACQWGMLVVLAKLGTPEMVGQFTLGFAITAPVILFSNLALRYVQATDAKHEYLFEDYLGLRLVTTTLAFLGIIGIILFAGYRWDTSLLVLLIGLAKALESISDVFYGLLQQHERMERIAISMIIKGALSLLLLGSGVYLGGSVLWGAVGLAFAWAVVLVGYDIRSGKLILHNFLTLISQGKTIVGSNQVASLRPRWLIGTLRRLAWLSLPLGLAAMLFSLNANIPIYFIQEYLGERDLGIFAAMSYLVVAGGTVVSALGQSAAPRMAKYYAEGNVVAFRMLLLKLMGVGTLLGVAGILAALVEGQKILTVIYRPEYAEYVNVFAWLMTAATASYVASFAGYGMTAAHYFKIQPIIFAASTMLTTILCPLLIPSNGILGAALVILVVNCVQMAAVILCNAHAINTLKITNALPPTRQD